MLLRCHEHILWRSHSEPSDDPMQVLTRFEQAVQLGKWSSKLKPQHAWASALLQFDNFTFAQLLRGANRFACQPCHFHLEIFWAHPSVDVRDRADACQWHQQNRKTAWVTFGIAYLLLICSSHVSSPSRFSSYLLVSLERGRQSLSIYMCCK